VSEARILVGNAPDVLADLEPASIHACVTSPPYYRLREYGDQAEWPEITYAPMPGIPTLTVPAQRCELGLEHELSSYVGHLVHVFRAVRRVLRPDGTLWLNLGDGWASAGKRGDPRSGFNGEVPVMRIPTGVKRKDLIGVPWRVAFALQADGWWLRSEIVWNKPNALPDPTKDRVTRSHETVFHLAVNQNYFHDSHAIREAHSMRMQRRPSGHKRRRTGSLILEHTWSGTVRDELGVDGHPLGRNARSVWSISTTPFEGAHFAVMPRALAERCVLASTSARGVCTSCGTPMAHVIDRRTWDQEGHELEVRSSIHVESIGEEHIVGWERGCTCEVDALSPATVLDPFCGAATTGVVALSHGRTFVGIEISEEYALLSRERIAQEASQGILFTDSGVRAPHT